MDVSQVRGGEDEMEEFEEKEEEILIALEELEDDEEEDFFDEYTPKDNPDFNNYDWPDWGEDDMEGVTDKYESGYSGGYDSLGMYEKKGNEDTTTSQKKEETVGGRLGGLVDGFLLGDTRESQQFSDALLSDTEVY